MSLMKQFAASQQTSTVRYQDVVFNKRSFNQFMNSLVIHNLISEHWSNDNGVWDDSRRQGGIVLYTDTNPMVSGQQTHELVFGGSREALMQAKSVLREAATYSGADILDDDKEYDFQYHNELNPMLWKFTGTQYRLHRDVKATLLDAATAFYEFVDLSGIEYDDVVITGSSANFNWNDASDIDIHIRLDMSAAEDELGPLLRAYITAQKTIWNDLHDISVHGIPVEFYIEDTNEPAVSAGVYSIIDNVWLDEPLHHQPTVDDVAVRAKLQYCINLIKNALSSNKADVVEEVVEKLHRMRSAGLSKAGEFSTANIVYKTLRNRGWIDRLYNVKTKLFDRDLSIEDEEWSELIDR